MTTTEWPAQDLETLGRCIVCGSPERATLFDRLRDKAFGAAPGEWALHRCQACEVAYLDPRPTRASIGRAYSRYYTHTGEPQDNPNLPSRREGLKGGLKNGYLKGAYGHAIPGANLLGYPLVSLRPSARLKLDFSIRHLPAPRSTGAKLLDVGCGNGGFLPVAQELGYAAVGLEPDPKAVEAGRAAGLDIREGLLPTDSLPGERFEQITLNHVLEHLHDPVEALRQAFDLLEPGGRLWMSQPNLNALGLKRFGADWRGLETPRHLSLYAEVSLRGLLKSLGYGDIRRLGPERAADFYYRQSSAMAADVDPYDDQAWTYWNDALASEAAAAEKAAARNPDLAESLTMSAYRSR